MTLQKYTTKNNRIIYQFPVRAFPELVTNLYVIDNGGQYYLVDCGSGLPDSNQQLIDGFTAIQDQYNAHITLQNLHAILITHGHMDHFGGLSFVREFTNAPIGVHLLDVRVLSHYEERRTVAARQLEIYLEQAGISPQHRQNIMQLYLYAKGIYRSTAVQFTLDEGQPFHDIDIYHVPGHCPGQVCLKIDDIMLTADHILSRITPHQAPESITLNMGLGHYLNSLDKIGRIPGIQLGLGGHEKPMEDIYSRIDDIKKSHGRRLDKVLDICTTPKTIAQISQELFGSQNSYHVLLALEEAGAHAEFLYQRGALIAANIAEIEQTTHPIIQYQRV